MDRLTVEEIKEMEKDYLTAKEAASALGVARSTFYKYAKEMKFPVFRIGVQYRVHREPFLEFLTTGKVSKRWQDFE